MKKHLVSWTAATATVLTWAPPALAEDGASDFDGRTWGMVAAGLAIAIAACGGAIGQGRAAAAALEGIARNPGASGKLFVPMILGLALIESLVIYALVISLRILGMLG